MLWSHIKFVVGGPEGHEKSYVILKQGLLAVLGPGLQNRHMAVRLVVPFFLGASGPRVLTGCLFAPDLITQPAGALTHALFLVPGCGAGTREHGKLLPSLLHQPNPSPSPGCGPLKGNGGRVFWLQESANGTLLITM